MIFASDADPISLVWSTMGVCDHITARQRGDGVWIKPQNVWVGKSADNLVEVPHGNGLERAAIGVLRLEP